MRLTSHRAAAGFHHSTHTSLEELAAVIGQMNVPAASKAQPAALATKRMSFDDVAAHCERVVNEPEQHSSALLFSIEE
jgi:hypothetical protein